MNETQKLIDSIVEGIQQKRGKDVKVIDLREVDGASTDYMIFCHGSSTVNVDAICNGIAEEVVSKLHIDPRTVEGLRNAQWVVVDYFDVIVHVFLEEYRSFYNIEDLWSDGELTLIESEN
ncbi:ribosome silencing factor [Halosquirtibacter xylanolyticus]|uniref:ribosome silencing factor n=1 Tax=Halosquirtibacter xylanolyticus TaxID=3374599 RepID=UPI0037488CA9|nr:ribosome silencing factor [Prolixibacteraceae bacterium]